MRINEENVSIMYDVIRISKIGLEQKGKRETLKL